jgi:hypothetical protein
MRSIGTTLDSAETSAMRPEGSALPDWKAGELQWGWQTPKCWA